VRKVEKLINRKINTRVLKLHAFDDYRKEAGFDTALIMWNEKGTG
jgi:hypothetical protein